MGFGTRVAQANSLFKLLDEDGGGEVSRAELLKFVTDTTSEDVTDRKVKGRFFLQIGQLFELLDADGGG
jgi:Ca2+-binding EF-hand superfamily protein